MMETSIFIVSFISGVLLVTLSFLALVTKKFRFWPPPHRDSWQFWTFCPLYRILFAGVVILSILDFNTAEGNSVLRYYVGIPLAIIAFTLTFCVTFNLGWGNAHGKIKGLKMHGFYRWSRNPMYVTSMIGFIGLSLTVNSMLLNILLVLWTMFYFIAPFLEEPWMESHYGKAFITYRSQVPRFLGWPRNLFNKNKTICQDLLNNEQK